MYKNKIKKYINKYNFYLLITVITLFLILSFITLLIYQYHTICNSSEECIPFIKYLDIYASISAAAVIIGTVIAVVELHGNKKINEADYIKDLNKQFISNDEMVEIEHALETYNNKYFLGEKDITLNLDIRVDGKDRQKLVNYLVYLEGVASIIENGILHIKSINSLFGYRFFLAVNNPVVQNIELYPFSTYYQGIFNVYDKWIDKCKDKNSKIFMQVPLNEYKLNTQIHLNYNQRVRKANLNDDIKTIASLIYQADDNIYPTLFGNKSDAINALSELIKQEEGFFSYKNILVLTQKEKNGEEYVDMIIGALLYNDGQRKNLWKEKQIRKFVNTDIKSFSDVSKNYFNKYTKKRSNNVEIIALCVNEDLRSNKKDKHYYGFFLMNQLTSMFCDKTLSLEVLENNKRAIHLYEKYFLFKKVAEYPGYFFNTTPVTAFKMVRKPLINTSSIFHK